MEKQFLKILESSMSRFTRGGFLVGDVVTFKKGFQKDETFSKLGQNVKDMVDEMLATKLNLRVVGIKNMMPSNYPGSDENQNGQVVVDIALDHMGGRYSHYTTIPTSCLEVQDTYPNLPKAPDSAVYDNKEQQKPVEVKSSKKDETSHVKGGDYDLATSDTKNKFAKQPYTHNYLTGLN